MKTNEVERKLGISKQTLFFYESEGLVSIDRDENGYRNYSDEAIQVLALIKYLRNLDLSIDDIKLLLENKRSFHEILALKSAYLDQMIESQNELLASINTLRDSEVPLIPSILTLEKELTRYPLSYWKSTPAVSIGRRLTRGLIFRWILVYSLISLMLSFIISYRFNPGQSGISRTWIGFIVFMLLFAVISVLILSDKIPSGYPLFSSRFLCVEFIESGLRYYQPKGIRENTAYVVSVIRGEPVLSFKAYEEIEKISIRRHKRYMRPSVYPAYAPAIGIDSCDFIFSFTDHTSIYLYAPLILNNDSELIAHIITDKKLKIDDPEKMLDSFMSGHDGTKESV